MASVNFASDKRRSTTFRSDYRGGDDCRHPEGGLQAFPTAETEEGEDASSGRRAEIARQTRRFLVGLACTLPLFSLAWKDLALSELEPRRLGQLLFLALQRRSSSITVGILHGRLEESEIAHANMDVLVAMGLVAYLYSLACFFSRRWSHVYFETRR